MSILLTIAALALPTHTPAAAVASHPSVVMDGVRRERSLVRIRRAWRVHSRRVHEARIAAQADRVGHPTVTTAGGTQRSSNGCSAADPQPSGCDTATTYAPGTIESAICAVFGNYCEQAISVARCESTLNPAATNGQYYGLFQLGERERAYYGDGADAYSQASAAYRYFADTGFNWSPWACAWAAGY